MDMPKTHRELFRSRLDESLSLRVVKGVHHFTGTATDDYDGNVTPLSVTIGIQYASLTGHVRYGRGTLHNSPTTAIWLGTVGDDGYRGRPSDETLKYWGSDAVGHRNADRRVVKWREMLQTRNVAGQHFGCSGLWDYEGEIDEAGTHIRGSFHLKIMPRKRGTFELWLRPAADSDPTTLDDFCRLVLSEKSSTPSEVFSDWVDRSVAMYSVEARGV